MAFTPFYLIAGGTGSADINAGSTIGAAVGGPTTGGSWTNATNTFVATGGTPFATANVGDYVSIYADGATVTTYVAQITTVVSNVSVILSGTIKYGTAPTDGAANRSAVLGGSWNTEQVLAAGGLATTTVPQSTKINIKGNLTITASRTISMAGATTTPLWFSGYNTTPGDLDNDTTNSLAKPAWSLNSTFQITTSGAHQIWTSLNLTGSRSGTIWTASGANIVILRCRSSNTSANAAAIAIQVTATAPRVAYSWFKTPTTATTSGTIAIGTATSCFIGVVAEGGGIAGFNSNATAQGVVCINCVGLSNTGAGFRFVSTPNRVVVSGCTVYGATVDGVLFTAPPNDVAAVVGCLFSGLNGSTATTNGINSSSGTNTNTILRACNDYYNVTNAEVGFGDSPSFFGQTDSSPVVISATDMTPVATSNAINHGFPGIVENQTYSSYPPIGSVTPLASSGGGSAVAIFGS